VQQLSDLAAIETRPAKDPQKLAGLAREIAAIPEADTTPHRSKRTAASADQASAERAEKLKAARNLDFPCSDGNKTTPNSTYATKRQFQMGFSSSLWASTTKLKRTVPNGVSEHALT
jgi:hypothetical protein